MVNIERLEELQRTQPFYIPRIKELAKRNYEWLFSKNKEAESPFDRFHDELVYNKIVVRTAETTWAEDLQQIINF